MKWLILALFCMTAYAATDMEDGSLLLSPQEVTDTRKLFADYRWKVQEQQMQIQELQKQVEFWRTSRCL